MTVFELQRQLRETGRYTTPERGATPRPCFAAWQFHGRMLRSLVSGLFAAPHGKLDRQAWAILGHAPLAKAERLGARVTCEGFDQALRCASPIVYVANHMSMMETIVLPPLLLGERPLAIVLKESLTRIPLLGPVFRSLEPICVSRRNARADLKAVLEQGRSRLQAGASVLLFPQATRSLTFDTERFNTLGEKLSREAGVPLAPIAVQTDFSPPGRLLRDFGPVYPERPIRFSVGPPIPPDLPRAERHRQTLAFITGRLRQWGLPIAEAPTAVQTHAPQEAP